MERTGTFYLKDMAKEKPPHSYDVSLDEKERDGAKRGGSTFKSTGCSCREPGFGSHRPHQVAPEGS